MLGLVEGANHDVSTVHLPRSQAGSQSQHLLLTLLGEYFLDSSEHLASAGLVSLLAEFGVTSTGARAALSRLSRRGLLASTKTGRHTSYRLTPRATTLLREEADYLFGFGLNQGHWSGRWTVVAFSVPEDQRQSRPALRARLRWFGFAPLYDGVWISPHPPTDEIDRVLEELEIHASTVFVGDIRDRVGSTPPLSAWDLGALRTVYADFIEKFVHLRRRVGGGDVGAAEALVARTTIMDRWRTIADLDPDLPSELLPKDWPQGAARSLFVEVHEGLGALAEMRVRQVLAELSGAGSTLVSQHNSGLVAR